jgi:GDP-mannose 6-dehydrogenase
VAFVCVGTPSGRGGQLDASALLTVLDQIGRQIRQRDDYPIVVIRSTVSPNMLKKDIVARLTRSCGALPGSHYGLVVMPEFLREGSSVDDFYNPPFVLIGESGPRAGDVLERMFNFITAPRIRTGMAEALMVKYASNAFHAVKVAFANEIGLLCAQDGIDSQNVMNIFCRDTKLNISKSYLMPGFAFGGSCLPKDLRALNYRARQANIETPLLNSILPSNRAYLEHCIDRVLATGRKHIGIFGMSFKSGTDDLRESPMIALIEVLIGKNKSISIYDSNVSLARLTGANRNYIESAIPHIASLMKRTIQEVIDVSDVLLVGNKASEFNNLSDRIHKEQILLDFSQPLTALHAGLTSEEGSQVEEQVHLA